MIGEAVRENYRRQGEYRERERILKLLTDYSKGETLISVDVAIALIKGENK